MKKIEIEQALTRVKTAQAARIKRVVEFDAGIATIMRRLLHEAAANYMSVEEVSDASGFSPSRVRQMMRDMNLNPRDGKRLLSRKAAEALATNSALMGIEPSEMDLMSPLAYLPMGEELRRELAAQQTVSGNLEDRLYHAIVSRFEGMGEAWTTDTSGDTLARAAAEVVVREMQS